MEEVYLLYVVKGQPDVLVAAKYFPSGQYDVFSNTGYSNRVEFSRRATFTVKNIVPSDSRRFKCVINFNTPPQVQGATTSIFSSVEVVVVGEYQSFFNLQIKIDFNSQVMILSIFLHY